MPVNLITTALMPISQAVSWTLLLRSSTSPDYTLIAGLAQFYCGWALYNRYLGGIPQELGQFSMGLMAMACYTTPPSLRRLYSLVGCGLILLNYMAPLVVVLPMRAAVLARKFKKDTSQVAVTWAYIFKLYLLSNLALWSTIFYQIYQSE